MKELQQKIHDYLQDRPIMRDHDTEERMALRLIEETIEARRSSERGEGDVGQELADVGWYLLAWCDMLDIDLEAEIEKKIEKNHLRFPSELFQEGDFQTVYISRKRQLGEISGDSG